MTQQFHHERAPMPRSLRRARSLSVRMAATLVFLAAGLPNSVLAQGFGSAKKKVTLHRKLPPTAHLNGSTINVEVTGHNIQTDTASDLRNMLEAELLKNDHRLRSEDKHPDSVIVCNITEYVPPTAQTSTQSTYGPGSKKPQQQTVTRYSGILKLAYTAKDALFSDAVSQIAARLVNTDEPVEVLLARGKLDDADKLAEAGLWSRNLETLETMTPFANKEDDSYRLYNIGVAYEALAYGSEDPKAATKYLQEAAINYGKAIDDKPSEKYFMEPQKRIDTAIAHYKTLREQPNTLAGADASSTPASDSGAKSGRSSSASTAEKSTTTKSTSSTTTPSAAKSLTSPSPKKPAGPPLTNDQVIQMAKAGLDEDNIIDTIKSAGSVNFDLSVDGQVKLAQNGVKGKILTAMKAKARQSPAH